MALFVGTPVGPVREKRTHGLLAGRANALEPIKVSWCNRSAIANMGGILLVACDAAQFYIGSSRNRVGKLFHFSVLSLEWLSDGYPW